MALLIGLLAYHLIVGRGMGMNMPTFQKAWDVMGNQLSSVPAELGQLIKLDVFDLSQNPLFQNPPPEVVQQGVPAILAYLQGL